MADSTIPNLVAVTVPAGTDLFGVRQSGDARDKKLTATQLLSLGSVPDPLLLGDGAVGAPTYSFSADSDTGVFRNGANLMALVAGGTIAVQIGNAGVLPQIFIPLQNAPATPSLAFGDGDTGFYENADDFLSVAIAGVRHFVWTATTFQGVLAGAGVLRDEVASATNPTLNPSNGDSSSGIGQNAINQVSIIGASVELARAAQAAGANQFIVAPGVVQSNPVAPSLAFGDGDTGFFESSDDLLVLTLGATPRFFFNGNNLQGNVTASATILNESASATNPTLCPSSSDLDTGIGSEVADQLDLIAGALSCMAVRETAAARQIGFYVTAPISLQTGVAVTAAGIHAALVNLGLITA